MVGSISSGAAGTMSAVLVGLGSFEGVSQVFYLFIVWTDVSWEIALSGWFIILSKLFILTYVEGKLCGERSLVNIWYCVSFLLNINSALIISRAFLPRWLIYWRNAFINLQLL